MRKLDENGGLWFGIIVIARVLLGNDVCQFGL